MKTYRSTRFRKLLPLVGADEFIKGRPNIYEEDVKERGAAISVGQKQLISFARALAHDPQNTCSRRSDGKYRYGNKTADTMGDRKSAARQDEHHDGTGC